jgi:membrane protein
VGCLKSRFSKEDSPLSEMLRRLRTARDRVRRLLEAQIWDQDLTSMSWFRAFLYRQLRVGVLVIRGCTRGRIAMRASSMTFTTLLTLVPLLILAFSIIRALGGFSDLETRLELFILDNFAPGSQAQVRRWLLGFFENIRSGAYNSLSALLLLGGGLGLLGSVEGAFNDIWGIHRGRSLFQRFSTYTTIIVFGPLLVGLSLSMTASLRTSDIWDRMSQSVPLVSGVVAVLFQLVPVLLMGLALTVLYLVMPNARVRFRSALPSGLAAGILWELTKRGYSTYIEKATHYGTLYGSLAAIPLFFLWVYLTWLVVLFGAHLTFAQEAADIRVEEGATRASLVDRLRAGLHLMLAASASYRHGQPPPDLPYLARRLGLPLRLLRTAAETLIEAELLHVVASRTRDWALVPAKAPERTTLMDIWRAFAEAKEGEGGLLDRVPAPPQEPHEDAASREVDAWMRRMVEGLEQGWGRVTLAELLERVPKPEAQEEPRRIIRFPSREKGGRHDA